MDDQSILALFNARSETAIAESQKKYGALCRGVAMRILGSREDAEEAENDAYLRAWNAIPPAAPASLGAYLAAVCRRVAIDRLRGRKRIKRGAGEYERALEELDGAADPAAPDPADVTELKDALERFLAALDTEQRQIFLLRYFWFCGIKEICRQTGKSESAVKMTLSRTRSRLKACLTEEQV